MSIIKDTNNERLWSNEGLLKINILPAFWQTWWFRSIILLLLLTIFYVIYHYQLNQRTLKIRIQIGEALSKQREAELQKRIVLTEISALRTQMNPHFIFNCLNSIQLFTAQNKADKASEYLTKFSRLIRLVLENAWSEQVTLENEIETLKLYIEMEVMRFSNKLTYKIDIDKKIDTSYVQIPSLLIQPFVENAIWHGLMHKENGGMVKIEVSQPTDALLHIEIIDNGIGREKAMEFNSKSTTKSKSFGMKVTTERIELINQIYNTTTNVQIIDLKNQDNEAIGTKVIVEIPLNI